MKSSLIIAALFAATNAVKLNRVHHPSKESSVMFAEGMTDPEVDDTDWFKLNTDSLMVQQKSEDFQPTCDKFETTNCQPNCSDTLTTGCTEARTPNAPARDRYEGRRTFKGPEKPESPWGV